MVLAGCVPSKETNKPRKIQKTTEDNSFATSPMTAAALVAEPGQPLDPVFPVEPEPRANRIVVEQKNRPDW